MTPDQRAERLRHHMYDTCVGIREQSERIVALEELVADMLQWDEGPCKECFNYDECKANTRGCEFWSIAKDRARELGVLT